ncbi:hypothetical protein EDD86DRAFT_208924 [Gorgonomyces haynaldii]|nr:hypothetical protein EDD86DRAFT_208924 [Gorgonomyces haynaldii]
MFFKNLFIVHKQGKICFSKNFAGEPLDQALLLGFSSSISNFCKQLLGEDVKELNADGGRIVFKNIGSFIFVCHCDLRLQSSIVQSILTDLTLLMELLFGSCEQWDGDLFDVNGAQDILLSYFKGSFEPSVLTGGVKQISLDLSISERLDKLLGSLESQDGICGNGTLLLLGNSVLHSRMSLSDTRQLLQYYKCRPLGSVITRFTPIYRNGSWSNLYIIQMHKCVLMVTSYIEKPLEQIQPAIHGFSASLMHSKLDIPLEEPPSLLRTYAKRETLAMLYHNMRTGITVFPQLRAGPESQQRELIEIFWSLYSEVSAAMRVPGVTEFSIVKDSYRFYCKSETVHKLYLLLGNESLTEHPSVIANDVLKHVKSQENQ